MNVEALYGKEIAYPGTVRFDNISAELLQKVQDLYAIIQQIDAEDFSTAEANAIALKESNFGFLNYMASVKEILIRTKQRDVYYLTEEEIATLVAIATLCPETGGKAIRLAQVLLSPYFSEEDAFLPCSKGTEIGGGRKANATKQTEPIVVYPNPANKVWMIQLPEESSEAYTLQLMDLTTQKVSLQQALTAGQNTLHLEHLPAGVYFYKIEKNGLYLESGKLIIVH